jgi:acetyl-CoA carboxylase carboxyltransferase component
VVHARTIAAAAPEDRADLHRQLAEAMADATNPYAAAGVMTIDEVIEPSATRAVLRSRLARLAGRSIPPASSRPLAYWPTC